MPVDDKESPTAVVEVDPAEADPYKSLLAKVEEQVRVRDEEFYSVYANSLALGMTSWDTYIVFGEITDQKFEGKPVIRETFKVSMTREVMKIFSHILSTNIAAYEKVNGEIKVPEIQLRAVQNEMLSQPENPTPPE